MKKLRFLGMITAGIAVMVLFQRFAPPPPPSVPMDVDPKVKTLEQTPPQINHVWVQKMTMPLPGGQNMIMKLDLDTTTTYDPVGDTVTVYFGSGPSGHVTFRDNGFNPDITAGDGIFSAFITEDIGAFRSNMIAAEAAIQTQGHYLKFIGHAGYDITEIPHFNVTDFDLFHDVEVNIDIANSTLHMDCQYAIDKAKSLLITDLSVVEDMVRTYDVYNNSGSPMGAWTFGQLIKNMCGTGASDADAANLLKSWIRHWTQTITLNGHDVAPRESVYSLFLLDWMDKCGAGLGSAALLHSGNWESVWDARDPADIVKYAPFRLTAIVNRMDLRGSSGYSPTMSNSGETRFIFTLVNDSDGELPVQIESGLGPADRSPDWVGLNVILEYSNLPTNICDTRLLAMQWRDLSMIPYSSPGNDGFNTALQALTDPVTAMNAIPSRPNGSALLRMRTNERIFYKTTHVGESWEESDWQFRQFELDPVTHLFKQVLLPNTPADSKNLPLAIDPYSLYHFEGNNILATNMLDWMSDDFSKATILRGNHNLPATYKYVGYPGTDYSLQAGAADVHGEYVHYWEPSWRGYAVPNRPVAGIPTEEELNVRHQVSLNTCQGCHSGETKTIFTQVAPMKAHQKARYWLAPPDSRIGTVDTRIMNNDGTSIPPGWYPYPRPLSGSYIMNVSAFLTGRNYSGRYPGTYDDDKTDVTEDATDNTMSGLFYVKDPSSEGYRYELMFGYNDLERRLLDLCRLINTPCIGAGTVIPVTRAVTFTPLPFAGH